MNPLVTHAELASYLQLPDLPMSATETVLDLANQQVGEIVGDNVTTLPGRAKAIALEVAARPVRAAGYTSVTTATDGTTRTWRRETATAAGAGVFLTTAEKDELYDLAGRQRPRRRRPRSIRLYVP